jgi:hypothetical protein
LSGSEAWTVHSVFARALNLRSEDGDFLGLALAPAPNGPATVILSNDGALAPLGAYVDVGSAALAGDTGLTIGRLTVLIRAARIWSPPPVIQSLESSTVLARVEQAAAVAARCAPDGGLAPLLGGLRPPPPVRPTMGPLHPHGPLPRVAGEGEAARSPTPSYSSGGGADGGGYGDLVVESGHNGLNAVVLGWDASDVNIFGEGCKRLSGLGPGLTPSGDDLLAGLALGLRAAGGTLPEAFGHAMYAATDGRTNDLARERVRHAVEGYADKYADAVLRALVMDADADVSGAVTGLVSYGHTSGVDTLVGLLTGVRLGLGACVRVRVARVLP